ncbi:MAG: efflux RND transporter periplasmic adaptor subunit [Prevotellaceae bacterium]|jgi:RND family efflux transporter MFP subunit|nr:efflux RND transporter periplasmic adaptor subunit [Prevotellaceae bacterium]
MKKVLYPLIIVVLYACHSGTKSETVSRPVKTDKVVVSADVSVEVLSGSVVSGVEANPSFSVPGLLSKVYVKEGEQVRKGQLIAEISSTDYQAAFIAAQSKYNQVNAEVQRVEELFKRGSVAKNEYEKAISGRQSIASLYETAKNQLSETKLYSPIDGTVQSIDAGLYQTTIPGVGVITIVNTSTLSVESNISSSMFVKRNNFKSFLGYSPYLKDSIPLKLSFILPKANNNQLYRLKLEIDSKYVKSLAPGMTLEIKLTVCNPAEKQELAVALPAVFNEDGKNFVWLVDTVALTVEKRLIVTGNLDKEGNITVLSGLNGNETVVSAGVHHLENGQRITVLE